MKRTIIIVVCILLMGGCSAFNIHEDNKSIKGIPFYIKKGVVKQVTTYTRSWIEATINYYKVDTDKKKVAGTERSVTIFISESTYNQIELEKAFDAADQSAASGGFIEAIKAFHKSLEESCNTCSHTNCEISPDIITKEADPVKTKEPGSLLQTLETNSFSWEAMVDYTKKYYFNAEVPPFGTTTASTKLASDGTLTEASSTVDSSKLAELIPLKELLIDKLGLGEKEKTTEKVELKAERNFALTLSISINGYKYNLTKYHKYYPYEEESGKLPLDFDTTGISVSRFKFGSEPKKDDEKKKKTISIEGSIVLPEDK